MKPILDDIKLPQSPARVNIELDSAPLAVDRSTHPNALYFSKLERTIPGARSDEEQSDWLFPVEHTLEDGSKIVSFVETPIAENGEDVSKAQPVPNGNPLSQAPLTFKYENPPSPALPSHHPHFVHLSKYPLAESVQRYFEKLFKSLDKEEEKYRLKETYRSILSTLYESLCETTKELSPDRLELISIDAKKSLYETYLSIAHDMESIERFQRRALDRHLFKEIFEDSKMEDPPLNVVDPYQLQEEVPLNFKWSWWAVIKVNARNFLLLRFAPYFSWIIAYRRRFIFWDVLAGLVTGTLCIAQGLAFGLLAGLPPVYGLYCALIPPVIYMLFGTSPHISIGPAAIPSLLIGESVQRFPDIEDRIDYALMASFFIGCILFCWSMFTLGFIVDFFSGSIMIGFQTAVAVIIMAGQIRHIMGLEAPRAGTLQVIITNIVDSIEETRWQSVLVATLCFLLVFFFRHFRFKIRGKRFSIVRFPYQILLILVSILVVFTIHRMTDDDNILNEDRVWNLKIVGSFSYSLPTPRIPRFSLIGEEYSRLLLDCFSISFITVIITISIGRRFATLNNYDIQGNQEIYALALSHLVGCIFQAYPHGAGFGRSVTHGGITKSQLSNLVISLVILFTLLVVLPIFFYLPVVVLAVLIIMSVCKLIPWRDIWYTFKVRKMDFLIIVVAFLTTLFVGVIIGVIVAAVVTFIVIVFRASRPTISILGRVIGTSRFANARFYRGTVHIPGILVIRFDSDLYFINSSYLQEFVFKRMSEQEHVWAVILDCESVSHIDVSGIQALQKINKRLHQNGAMLLLAHMKYSIQEIIKKADPQFTLIHESQYFPLVYVAEQEALRQREIIIKDAKRAHNELQGMPIQELARNDRLLQELLDQSYTQKQTPAREPHSARGSSAHAPSTAGSGTTDSPACSTCTQSVSPTRTGSQCEWERTPTEGGSSPQASVPTTKGDKTPQEVDEMEYSKDTTISKDFLDKKNMTNGVDPNLILFRLPNQYQNMAHSPKDFVSKTGGLETKSSEEKEKSPTSPEPNRLSKR
uniref:STAS domain-containing protein n=1 Tax=Percolomonas cosmopolitus TaxID=63605 RepID=A0A7S1PFS1_9EUKA|mmetsp:Transcript_1316/g.4516  ORF Transcript_1316/g.4516 Transcript_1316/m.4516 type:complete len:1037 (+) Transcript_1316:312-3422(+)|eukprot:CAMPEP_0117440280 /NCGR_PEP_ID=MMETSP0759-20121206/3003_1 /TAXON_ID=63605 /ORGANISM="Percolomonas cosmopolitus, Strain WS" /LENGTH=1036 /DNA_ID=CAMNT_0005232029 /DNA_START=291 /DNA_END=3401 /DNA_ORIENTATION=+